ncbi:Eco57I restriction-modification methylase domain-containing protein [Streptomyces albidoflavus]
MSTISKPRGRRPGQRKGPPPVDPRRHHLSWLELVDVSGPFLTLPVLLEHWDPGLDALERPARQALREAHEQWQQGRAAGQGEWITFVLRELLEWQDALRIADGDDPFATDSAELDKLALDVPQHETRIRPDFALFEPGTGKPALLGLILPIGTDPTRRLKGSAWSATPADRLAQLCRHHGVELGLATDGRWWSLVWAPRRGVTSTAVFDAMSWPEQADRDVVRAFRSLLRRSRFFSVPEDERLPALMAKSLKKGADLTEGLGRQVRQAVEMLVDAIGRANPAIDAQDAYRGAVAVMMRIVFLFYAEERELLPASSPIYARSYSASGLRKELKDQADQTSEIELGHSSAAWHRLIALFHAVYGGIDHPELPLPSYDGSLFSPDAHPWLDEVSIDDRTVLHMLTAVQVVELGTGANKELRQLSFRTLDVEQIGYVYEGLLAYEGTRATETVLGLMGKAGDEDEVGLSELDELARPFSTGESRDTEGLAEKLAETYKDSGIGSARAVAARLKKPFSSEKDREDFVRRLLGVTNGDRELVERLLPYAGLIRDDLRGDPVVILSGMVYVTDSELRQKTGTHYTPKELAEQVVEGALEPLVFSPGPLQTANRDEWKPLNSEQLLRLKVADIAMGSGAFLVGACRYLAERLVKAWAVEGEQGAIDFLGGESHSDASAETDVAPVVVRARRLIIEHCLYGVDINPMAVEMAKLSLWLVSMDPHRPFTFLDDRLIAGDSLLGITSREQLSSMNMNPEDARETSGDLYVWATGVTDLMTEVVNMRQQLVEMGGKDLAELGRKREILAEIREKTAQASLFADLVAGAALATHVKDEDIPHYKYKEREEAKERSAERRLLEAAEAASAVAQDGAGPGSATWQHAREIADAWLAVDLPEGAPRREPVHWPLVFPEVFESDGFDAVVGNPPFVAGSDISGFHGSAYRENLVHSVAYGTSGNADLVGYFMLRCHRLVGTTGQLGLIATNTLAQNVTRKVGLDQIVARGAVIRQSVKSMKWATKSAAVENCIVWTSNASLGEAAERIADGKVVDSITTSLSPSSRVDGNPYGLKDEDAPDCFYGTYIHSTEFTVSPGEAELMVRADPKNSEVLSPYLGGEVYQNAGREANRWVVNFRTWPEERARSYDLPYRHVAENVKPKRMKSSDPRLKEFWWRYKRPTVDLYEAISSLDQVIAIVRHSETLAPVFVDSGQVFGDALVIVASRDPGMLAVLASAPHYWWAIKHGSTIKGDPRYNTTSVYDTFPWPEIGEELRELGLLLDSQLSRLSARFEIGLTGIYHRVGDVSCDDREVVSLRDTLRSIDEAVVLAYGWGDLISGGLGHRIHPGRHGARYTVSPEVRREILDRLLEENHRRYAAEKAAGLHEKGAGKKAKKRVAKPAPQGEGLFDVE